MPELPLPGALDNTNLNLRDKIALFGPDAIPLILPYGSKGNPQGSPWKKYMDGWGTRTLEQTRGSAYQADLYGQINKNIGIRQGGGITQLVGWDFDIWDLDPWLRFLNANQWIKENALFTIGRKGFTFWFKISGLYPDYKVGDVWENKPKPPKEASKKDKETWEHIEWRGNGYSVIHGLYPRYGEDGTEYWTPGNEFYYQIFTVGAGLPEVPWGTFSCPDATFNKWPKLFRDEHKYKNSRPISKELLEGRLKIIGDLWPIIEVKDEGFKVNVECPNSGAHTSDTGEGQTIVYTGLDGRPATFHCSHEHCKDLNKELSRVLQERLLEAETIPLYDDARDQESRRSLVRKWVKSGNFYRRSGSHPFQLIYWRPDMEAPIEVNVKTFRDCCDSEGIKFSRLIYRKRRESYPTREQIEYFLHQPETEEIVLIKSISPKALLCKTDEGAKILARQFSRELSVIILGKTEDVRELSIPFEQGRKLILDLCSCLKFKTEGDKARALAQLLTPALIQGGFIERPVPIFLMASDQKGAGKSIWNFGIGDIYAEEIAPNTYEKFNLINGLSEIIRKTIEARRNFLFIDDLAKTVESPLLNAICTSKNSAEIRTAFREFSLVPIDHLSIAMAGVRTKFTLEEQLGSRVVPIRILKDVARRAPGGKFLGPWIKENARGLLAAIYSVITKWASEGYPLGKEESRFPVWAGAINGILEKIMGLEACTNNLEDLQTNTSDQDANWLEQIIPFLKEEGLVWEGNNQAAISLTVSELREFILASGLAIPGNYSLNSPDAPRVQRRILGRAVKRLKIAEEIQGKYTLFTLGDFFVKCVQGGYDTSRNPSYNYIFCNTQHTPVQVKPYADTCD